MSEHLYLVTIFLIAGTFLAVSFLKLLSARSFERAKASKEIEYRQLAEKVALQDAALSSTLAATLTALEKLQDRSAHIESILSQVD